MRAFLKAILETLGLLGPARKLQALLKRQVRLNLNRWLLFKNRVAGKSYAHFYEEMMDRRATRGAFLSKTARMVTGSPDQPRRQFAVKFLGRMGYLRPDSTLLDYGCGAVTTGVNFIKYLEPGKYYGADVSSKTLEVGRQWIGEYGLEDKRPTLIHLPGGSLANLPDVKFDVIFAQDVASHMPAEDIQALLGNLVPYMHRDSVLLATYSHTDQDIEYERDVVNWKYNISFFERIVRDLPLDCAVVEDWKGEEYKGVGHNKMVKFTRRDAAERERAGTEAAALRVR